MRRSIREIFILFVLVLSDSSLAGSIGDVFPLKVGNIWEYGYYKYTWQVEGPIITDTGTIVFSIVDSQRFQDTIYWKVTEQHALLRSVYWNGITTRDTINDTILVDLREVLATGHALIGDPLSKITWWSDTPTVYRFVPVDSVGAFQQSWMVDHTDILLTFKDIIGLVQYTAHTALGLRSYDQVATLRSSLIVDVRDDRMGRPPQPVITAYNYPNPFNCSTELNYVVTKTSEVAISIFNTLGERLFYQTDPAITPGSYRLIWDASKYSTGIYYCRIQTDGLIQTIKMNHVK